MQPFKKSFWFYKRKSDSQIVQTFKRNTSCKKYRENLNIIEYCGFTAKSRYRSIYSCIRQFNRSFRLAPGTYIIAQSFVLRLTLFAGMVRNEKHIQIRWIFHINHNHNKYYLRITNQCLVIYT